MIVDSQTGTNDFIDSIKSLLPEEVQRKLALLTHDQREQLFLSLEQDEEDRVQAAKEREENERLKQECAEKLHSLIEEWKKYSDDTKLADWEKVEELINSDYDTIVVNFKFVTRLVKILRMLDEQESYQKIKKFVFEDYNSFNDLTNMVIHFSKYWERYKEEVQRRDCWSWLKLIKDGESFSISDFFEHNKKKDENLK